MSATPKNNVIPVLRFDLEWIQYPSQNEWVVHDPLAGNFYRFNEFEHAAAQLMDGNRSFRDILASLGARFTLVKLDQAWLLGLMNRMQACFLLQPTSVSNRWLLKQARQQRNTKFWSVLLSPLSIRIPLFDPGRMLEGLASVAYLLFNPLITVLSMILGLVAATLVMRWAMVHGVPAMDPQSVTADRWIVLLVCYAVIKSIHELGHMLACARYRVRSTEVGILLLCLTPCFYCDTTDAWRLPSKWQRATIAAAGMYVELIMASVAALLWLFTHDGLLHLLSLNVMLICSISTVLINANPFLRYDGYYILSDLWGVPNLHEQSRLALRELVLRKLLRQQGSSVALDGNMLGLAAFAIASWVYRIVVLFAILWLCWTFLPPLGLGLVAAAVTCSLVLGTLIAQKRAVVENVKTFQRMNTLGRVWALVLGALVIGLVAFVFCLPYPRYVVARGYMDYADKTPIYANYDGKLTKLARKDQPVEDGQSLIEMQSAAAKLEIVKLEGELAQAEKELEQLVIRRTIDPDSEYEIPKVQEQVTNLKLKLQVLLEEFKKLVRLAPESGILIDASLPVVSMPSDFVEDRYSSTVLDSSHANSWVRRGDLIAWFSTRKSPVVVVLVPEHALQGFEVGLAVSVRCDAMPGDTLQGTVARIAPDVIERVPETMIGDATLVAIPSTKGYFEPETPHYEVFVSIPESELYRFGSLATARFQLETLPIYQHVIDYVKQSLKPITQ